jgi:hypothetical protein
MSGLTNSGRPGSGKNRFRLGARITLPVVAGYCYLFKKWVCGNGEVAKFRLEKRFSSTPKRRGQNHSIKPMTLRLNLLKEKKNLLLSLVE